jgi:hypothetical protein
MSLRDAEHYAKHRRIFATVAWVGLSLIFALFVPAIDYVISVIGGLAAIFILFFPGTNYFHLFVTWFSLASSTGISLYISLNIYLMNKRRSNNNNN